MPETKIGRGALLGAILFVLALFGTLQEGKPLSEGLATFPFAMILGIALVFWFSRDVDEYGDDYGDEIEPMQTANADEIRKLQRRLNDTLKDAAIREANGDIRMAQTVRAEAAVIESQLRSLGA